MITVYFDGLCEKNPGGIATYGFVVFSNKKKTHEGYGLVAESGTNNEAEYTALLKAIEYLVENNYTSEKITVHGDSELVINQMSRGYKVKAPNLVLIYSKIIQKIFLFKSIKFEWVPREKNKIADLLSRKAYDEYLENNA